MNDESTGVLLALFVVMVAITSAVLVGMARWFALAGLLGLVVTGAAVVFAWQAWQAWLRGDRHRLATRIRAQRADLAHRKAEALLELELEQARHDAGRARATVTRIQDAADQRLVSSLHLDPAADMAEGR